LFAILSESVNAVMLDPISFENSRSKNAREDTIREHMAILNCIRERDPEGARAAMLAVLRDAKYNWAGYPARDAQLYRPFPSVVKRESKSKPKAK
jgi:DNA-binding FadR family transcriptional regulator